jgi:hypothetical protein
MGFDIEGITLTSPSANALVVTNNTKTMTFDSGGRVLLPGTPVFTASGAEAQYEYPAGATTWKTPTFSQVLNNVGSCFNGGTGTFTAPITGRYLFTFTAYTSLGTASIASYLHPTFLVNGSWTSRRGGGANGYRLRGHGYVDNYKDMEISEIYALQANDYLYLYIYHSNVDSGIYSNYKLFTGTFLG